MAPGDAWQQYHSMPTVSGCPSYPCSCSFASSQQAACLTQQQQHWSNRKLPPCPHSCTSTLTSPTLSAFDPCCTWSQALLMHQTHVYSLPLPPSTLAHCTRAPLPLSASSPSSTRPRPSQTLSADCFSQQAGRGAIPRCQHSLTRPAPAN